ncbi:uncharacterized protein LOC143032003 isoform X1 [Oratosquilla oratoria]|uniref:uncharacterized protein LOC143032003 isoform X1 n=1 Tax=Oratosquilla oratoria TaxID=337810 RepID=UPI003F765369
MAAMVGPAHRSGFTGGDALDLCDRGCRGQYHPPEPCRCFGSSSIHNGVSWDPNMTCVPVIPCRPLLTAKEVQRAWIDLVKQTSSVVFPGWMTSLALVESVWITIIPCPAEMAGRLFRLQSGAAVVVVAIVGLPCRMD